MLYVPVICAYFILMSGRRKNKKDIQRMESEECITLDSGQKVTLKEVTTEQRLESNESVDDAVT